MHSFLWLNNILLPWKWTEIILSFLRLHPITAFWTLLLTMMAIPFILSFFLPTVAVDSYRSSELNSPIPVHLSLLIPRLSTFTLAVFYLTISNLPWFMDLTFQVPMQYCSLQHWILLLSPVTSTTGCCFCFGTVSSFFLELFLHWSPVAYWAPTHLGSSCFSVFLPFHVVHGVLKARILKWFAIPFSSGPHFVRTLHHDPSVLGGPTRHGS